MLNNKTALLVSITSFIFIFSQKISAYAPLCAEEKPTSIKTSHLKNPVSFPQLEILLAELGPDEIYAYKLYTRLTGSAISLESPKFKRIVRLVKSKQLWQAAQIIAEEEKFLEVRVRNFASPFSSKDFVTTEPFNDLQALIVGVVRDELDARLILTGNFRYSARKETNLPAVSTSNNDHYLRFEDGMFSYLTDLERVTPQWDNIDAGAGALTTRAWAKVAYEAGTNRRSLRNAIDLFLCAPIDNWKTRAVPDVFVRRDVDRMPGGNPTTYQNTCRSCHAIMDGMAGAFARADFTNNNFTFSKDSIMAKMNQNGDVYPEGFVTTDDGWTNLLNFNSAIDFGWRSEMKGTGIKEFANMLAQSKAYSRCMVQKVFSEVCGAAINDIDPELMPKMVDQFEADQRNLKHLFMQVATSEACLAHPRGQE